MWGLDLIPHSCFLPPKSRRGSPGSAAGAVTVSGRGPSKANLPVLPRRSSNQNFRPFYKPTLFVIFAERVMYFFANVFIVGTVIYTITHFVLAIRHDLAAMSNKYSTELKTKISECTHQYMQNKCHPDTRVRYMDEQCISWEICMNQKPSEVLQ